MKRKTIIILTCVFFLGSTIYLYSSQERPELKTQIVSVKYTNVNWIAGLLKKYTSPFGRISNLPRGNRLIIEDTPAMVEKILSILKEIDVKPLDLQFQIELLLASTASDKKAALDPELKSDRVIKELQSLLKYESFKRLDAAVIKVQDNSDSRQRLGGMIREGDIPRRQIDLRLDLRPRHIKEEKGEVFQTELRLSRLEGINNEGKEVTSTLIDTTLAIKSGERTVVGVSKLDGGGLALILILSGKVIK